MWGPLEDLCQGQVGWIVPGIVIRRDSKIPGLWMLGLNDHRSMNAIDSYINAILMPYECHVYS